MKPKTNIKFRRFTFVLPALTWVAATCAAGGASLFYTESGASENSSGYGDVGFSFAVTTSVSVTELSFFGISMGGGDTPNVQLWNDDTDTLLGAVSWAAGAAVAGWNSMALSSPVTLVSGVNYQVQGSAYWAPIYGDNASFTYGSEIDAASVTLYHNAVWSDWTPLSAPSSTAIADSTAPAFVNFTFTSVPEPSSALLSMLGAGVFLMRRRPYTRGK